MTSWCEEQLRHIGLLRIPRRDHSHTFGDDVWGTYFAARKVNRNL
jgi:hypothetical protein